MDVTHWPLLEEANSGEAECVYMAKYFIGASSVNRNVRRTPLSVWTMFSSDGDTHIVFWTPVSRVDLQWKADTLAKSIQFVHKARGYAVFTATTPTGEFFQFEVFPIHY